MEKMRKPFQGVLNIIRFNWHFYLMAIIFLILSQLLAVYLNFSFNVVLKIICFALVLVITLSLLVSYYVYDLSGLYNFDSIKECDDNITIVNINAGFDETSEILKKKFKQSDLFVFDFFDPNKHTEVSIKRARKRYPPYPNTKKIETSKIDLDTNSIDKVFLILSAHEIRNESERIVFFKELNSVLKPNGQILVVEHLRDFPNFIAYNIGAFHFHSKATWLNTFKKSELRIVSEIKNTAFISTFILESNGNTL